MKVVDSLERRKTSTWCFGGFVCLFVCLFLLFYTCIVSYIRFHNRCWLSTEEGFIWAFLGPVLLIIAVSTKYPFGRKSLIHVYPLLLYK